MTDKFEDMPDGAGKRATEADYKRIWLYMKSRNRKPSIRSVMTEIAAQNFQPLPLSTSQRWAKKLGLTDGAIVKEITVEADERLTNRRSSARRALPESPAEAADKVAAMTDKTAEQVERGLKARMAELLTDDNSSTQLAITENRTRMAFNIALMEFYASEPALVANARDTAALLDALTVAAKLSGGASIDITLPVHGNDDVSPNGHPMKTVTSPLAQIEGSLVASFNEFKARVRDGERA